MHCSTVAPALRKAYLHALVRSELARSAEFAKAREARAIGFYPSMHSQHGCPGEQVLLKKLALRNILVPMSPSGLGSVAAGQGAHDHFQVKLFPAGTGIGAWQVQGHEIRVSTMLDVDGEEVYFGGRIDTRLDGPAPALMDYKSASPFDFRLSKKDAEAGRTIADRLFKPHYAGQLNDYYFLLPEDQRAQAEHLILFYVAKHNWAVVEPVEVAPDKAEFDAEIDHVTYLARQVRADVIEKAAFCGDTKPYFGKTKCEYCTANELNLCPRKSHPSAGRFGRYGEEELLGSFTQRDVYAYLQRSIEKLSGEAPE